MADPGETEHAVAGIGLVSESSAARLNERQRIDYCAERRDCFEWLLALDTDPSFVLA